MYNLGIIIFLIAISIGLVKSCDYISSGDAIKHYKEIRKFESQLRKDQKYESD